MPVNYYWKHRLFFCWLSYRDEGWRQNEVLWLCARSGLQPGKRCGLHCRPLLLLLSSDLLWQGWTLVCGSRLWQTRSCEKPSVHSGWGLAPPGAPGVTPLLPSLSTIKGACYLTVNSTNGQNQVHQHQDAWFWTLIQLRFCSVTLIYIWKGAFYQLQSALGKLGSPEDSCHGSAHYSTAPATENVSAQVWIWCTGSHEGVGCI